VATIAEVRATIAGGVESADEAREALIAVRDRIRHARQLATVTHDSAHDRVRLGHSLIGQADTDALRALDLLKSAAETAGEYSRSLDG